MEQFYDLDNGGIVGIDGSRVSGNGKGIAMEYDERLLTNGGMDVRFNGDGLELGFVDDEKIGENLAGSRFNTENEKIVVSELGNFDAIDLVVDFNCYAIKKIDQNGDRFCTVDSFEPVEVVQCVQDLAKDPFASSGFEVLKVETQLQSFYRSKGYYQIHSDQVLEEKKVTKNGKLDTCGSVSQKHVVFDGGFGPSKKMKLLSELMSNGHGFKTLRTCQKRKDFESNCSREGIQRRDSDEFLSKVCLGAKNPIEEQPSLNSLHKFSSDFRNYRLETNSQFTGIEDSYWTDRIIQIDQKMTQENSATALILKFTSLDSIPLITNLNEIFRRYGPLRELETEVLKKNNCAKVVFLRRSDAETAFSSAGKFSIFGPALVSYCLDYSPTPCKSPKPGRKQKKTGGKSVKAMLRFEN